MTTEGSKQDVQETLAWLLREESYAETEHPDVERPTAYGQTATLIRQLLAERDEARAEADNMARLVLRVESALNAVRHELKGTGIQISDDPHDEARRVSALRAELSALRRDRERMDWLEWAALAELEFDLNQFDDGGFFGLLWVDAMGHQEVRAETLREAIDAIPDSQSAHYAPQPESPKESTSNDDRSGAE